MKIIHINSVYGLGSTGRIVECIHTQLLEEGHESIVVVGRNHPKFNVEVDHDTVIDLYKLKRVIKDAIPSLMFDTHGLHSKENTKVVIDKIKAENPDIIHLHNIHGFYLNYQMLFEYLNQTTIKIVWTLHDCWSFAGFCSNYQYNQCNKWIDGCHECEYRNVYPYRILSNSRNNYALKKALFTSNKNLTLVTPSRWLKEEVTQSFFKDIPCCVINNGVDFKDFYKDSSNFEFKETNGKKILLAVAGVWTKQKGYDEYIKLSKLITDDFVIVMIGVNIKQKKQLSHHGIIGVEKTKSLDEQRKWYSNSHFLINLTLEDNYPTVNLEAVSCGLRVLGYQSGGNEETILGYGECARKYDLNQIVTFIKADKCYEEIISPANKEKMYHSYADIYNTKKI
ncbi:MAG: glycosyltransferase [Erysipelotrichaceae bacterium]